MTLNPMFENIPSADPDELVETHGIIQYNYMRYREVRDRMVVLPTVGSRIRHPEIIHFTSGHVSALVHSHVSDAARGNLTRLMPSLVLRSQLAKSTIYQIMASEEKQEATIAQFECAFLDMIAEPDFDLPGGSPTLENLKDWLKTWVGSFAWMAEFIGVKENSLVAGIKRSANWQSSALEFARRWYEARCRQYERCSQEEFERRWIVQLESRERRASLIMKRAEEIAPQVMQEDIERWLKTEASRTYREDVDQFGEDRARRKLPGGRWSHPETLGIKFYLPRAVLRAEHELGGIIDTPADYNREAPVKWVRTEPPLPAEELWPAD